jgi:hypothetical protein
MSSEKLGGFLDDRLASLLNQACNSLYERRVLEARGLNTHFYCVLADKLKTLAIEFLTSSKRNNSRDGNYFNINTSTFIINKLFL